MKALSAITASLLISCSVCAQDLEVRVGVLRLFHPRQITIIPVAGKLLTCTAGAEALPAGHALQLEFDGAGIRVHESSLPPVAAVHCDDGQGRPTEVTVTVPQKISRHYQGRIDVIPQGRELSVVVVMDLETAVASVVAAESPPGAPLEALKAQAVATRSFFVAGKGRHRGFDFCDTTHCQFLRQPPGPSTWASRATNATRGLVLAYKAEVFPALYSASCGGRTHSLEELGIPVHGYPYFAVACSYCRQHPEKWVARISESDATDLSPTESSRLKLARKLGWKTVPSNSYSARAQGGSVVLEGVGAGHGIGLCQRGGADLARHGASFQQILEHYYPNTELKQR